MLRRVNINIKNSFIAWGVSAIHTYTNRYENNFFLEKLKSIVEKINLVLNNNGISDKSLLKGFKAFANKYLPYEIKREEITHVMSGEGIYILKFEYFGNTIPITKDIKYSKSASFYQSMFDHKEDPNKLIDESQNIKSNEIDGVLVYDHTDRPNSEREFIKRIFLSVSSGKKIIVQNKYFVDNITSILIRYVAYNSKYKYKYF